MVYCWYCYRGMLYLNVKLCSMGAPIVVRLRGDVAVLGIYILAAVFNAAILIPLWAALFLF